MIRESVAQCVGRTPLVRLDRCFADADVEVLAKLELMNPLGSVKDRPARHIIERGLADGWIRSTTHVIESTSGNLGIALATLCRLHGLRFIAVVDPKTTRSNLDMLRTLGAQIEMVDEPDDQGGYLKTRVRRAQELARDSEDGVWVNQYANNLNWQAHYEGTGAEIMAQADGPIDVLVAAVSTTGTIMGISRRLREQHPELRVVAVDAVGSVIFGGQPGPRELPGFGSSRVPELLCADEIDEVISVDDAESAHGCRRLAREEGIVAGGSSGAVVAAIDRLAEDLPSGSRIVTVLPDRGDRYLDLVFDDAWVGRAERRAMAT